MYSVCDDIVELRSLVTDIVRAVFDAGLDERELCIMLMHLSSVAMDGAIWRTDDSIARALDISRQYAQRLRQRAVRKVAVRLRTQGYDVEVGPFFWRRGWHTKNAGIRPGRAHKLNEAAVREIRRLAAQGVRRSELAQRYGVSTEMVRRIVRREEWRHVADEA